MLLKPFLGLGFASIDWISVPLIGLQGWRQADNGWSRPQVVHSADPFRQSDMPEELGGLDTASF